VVINKYNQLIRSLAVARRLCRFHTLCSSLQAPFCCDAGSRYAGCQTAAEKETGETDKKGEAEGIDVAVVFQLQLGAN